jgi:hypothetical protein
MTSLTMRRKLLAVLGAVWLLCSCTTIGPSFAPLPNPGPGKGVLYIYRAGLIASAAQEKAVIQVNGAKAGSMRGNGYIALPLSVGQHRLRQDWESTIDGRLSGKPVFLNVNVVEGQETYVRIVASYYENPSFGGASWRMEPVPVDIAKQEISRTRAGSVEVRP